MTKIQKMRVSLSAQALAALAGCRGDAMGVVVQAQAEVLAELRIRGAIGERDGLTLIGSCLAGRLQAELMDALF